MTIFNMFSTKDFFHYKHTMHITADQLASATWTFICPFHLLFAEHDRTIQVTYVLISST